MDTKKKGPAGRGQRAENRPGICVAQKGVSCSPTGKRAPRLPSEPTERNRNLSRTSAHKASLLNRHQKDSSGELPPASFSGPSGFYPRTREPLRIDDRVARVLPPPSTLPALDTDRGGPEIVISNRRRGLTSRSSVRAAHLSRRRAIRARRRVEVDTVPCSGAAGWCHPRRRREDHRRPKRPAWEDGTPTVRREKLRDLFIAH